MVLDLGELELPTEPPPKIIVRTSKRPFKKSRRNGYSPQVAAVAQLAERRFRKA